MLFSSRTCEHRHFKHFVAVFSLSNCDCEVGNKARSARSLTAETGSSPAKEAGTSQLNTAQQKGIPSLARNGVLSRKILTDDC